MKKLLLQTSAYRSLEKSYGEWLKCLGYNEKLVSYFPLQVREFLHWLEGEGLYEISELKSKELECFMSYFENRGHQHRGGGLSVAYINKRRYSLNLLMKYLHEMGTVPDLLRLSYEAKSNLKPRELLSREEVKLLYDSCGTTGMGSRDRAMLSVYYGCGLRRSEGVALRLDDVLFDRSVLHVVKSKNGHGRYVPMVLSVRQDLERYIYGWRQLVVGDDSGDWLFLSRRGRPLRGSTMLRRLKYLLSESGLSSGIGLHSLRHSIATHLLKGGMNLEEVSIFLGHRELNSSQTYTHLKERTWKQS